MNTQTTARGLGRVGRWVWRVPRMLLAGIVRLYQLGISPWFPPTCRYSPSCSQYAMIALRDYGAMRGSVLALWRIARCNPWGGHGHDPPRWFGEPASGADSATSGEEPRASGAEVAASGGEPPGSATPRVETSRA